MERLPEFVRIGQFKKLLGLEKPVYAFEYFEAVLPIKSIQLGRTPKSRVFDTGEIPMIKKQIKEHAKNNPHISDGIDDFRRIKWRETRD